MVKLSTAYFPPISWFALALKSQVELEFCENFLKQSYRNRCHLTNAGGLQALSIPVEHNGKVPIGEIRISYKENWQQIHLRALESAYFNSPYFEELHSELLNMYKHFKPEYLWSWNFNTIQWLCKWLNIKLEIHQSKVFIPQSPEAEGDFRYSIHPKKPELFCFPTYNQVFDHKIGFIEGLSTLDLLCQLGPDAYSYLYNLKRKNEG